MIGMLLLLLLLTQISLTITCKQWLCNWLGLLHIPISFLKMFLLYLPYLWPLQKLLVLRVSWSCATYIRHWSTHLFLTLSSSSILYPCPQTLHWLNTQLFFLKIILLVFPAVVHLLSFSSVDDLFLRRGPQSHSLMPLAISDAVFQTIQLITRKIQSYKRLNLDVGV